MSPKPTLTDREEKIKRIYEVIGYNKYIYEATSSDCGTFVTIIIGDVLDWISKVRYGGEYLSDFYDTHLICHEVGTLLGSGLGDKMNCIREKLREPLEAQSDQCIDYIDSLIASTK